MLWVIAIYLSAWVGPIFQAPICVPTFSEGRKGNPERGGYIYFECEISTCENLTKIVFEKTGLVATWTPIFEGISKTQYRALDTATEYTIENRNDYSAFRTKHTLNIDPLILEDHGKWRCVAYDAKYGEYKSVPLDFPIYVPPENFFIKPSSSDLVTNQPHNFTCVADGVYPEADLLWEVNGDRDTGLLSRRQRADQFWFVMNTIQIRFDTVGVNKLVCVIKAKAREQWLEEHINITVQEPATVMYPQHEIHVTVDVDATFSLGCSGSGYSPRIMWNRDGESINANNTRYTIKEECDNSKCNGSISSIPIDAASACNNEDQYTGAYTCIITLEPPYQSLKTSSNMKVTISKRQCNDENIGQAVGFSMLSLVCLVLLAFGIGFLIYQHKQKKYEGVSTGENEPDIDLYVKMVLQDEIKLKYKTTNKLQLCAQSQNDDMLILFEYETDRVFIHNISTFDNCKECKSDVIIWDMVRISGDTFVATASGTQDIHLLILEDNILRTQDTMQRNKDIMSTLICAETGTSFINCDVSKNDYGVVGEKEEGQYHIRIYRVGLTDKLKSQPIAKCIVNSDPQYTSHRAEGTRLIMVTLHGEIYNVDIQKRDTCPMKFSIEERLHKAVFSLYTNNNVCLLGDWDGKIYLYTSDSYNVVQDVEKPVNGITMRNRRMIVCCGNEGQTQHIKVFCANVPTNDNLNEHHNDSTKNV